MTGPGVILCGWMHAACHRIQGRQKKNHNHSLASTCSTANIPCLFSATRVARRSRAACFRVRDVRNRSKKDEDETYLVLDTARLHLVGEDLCTGLLSLGFVDVLHKHALILEDVTLRLLVERVVATNDTMGREMNVHRDVEIWTQDSQMLVDLARLTVLPEQPPQHPLSPHPQHFAGHPCLAGTLSLTDTRVPALALRGKEVECACARVDDGGLHDDATVLDELLYVRPRVGVANLRLLVGVEPNFSLADSGDGCGKPLLRAKVDHRRLSSGG